MDKIILISCICAILSVASCTGTNQQGPGTDSPQNSNDSMMNADTVIRTTDTTSTGIDHSGSGGTTAADSTH